MAMPTVQWLVSVAKIIGKLTPFFGTVVGLVTLVYDLGTIIIVGGLNFLADRLDAIDTSAFSNAGFGLISSIGYFNAVFPLSEAIVVWTALLTAKLAIVVIRWVKSLIPTLSN